MTLTTDHTIALPSLYVPPTEPELPLVLVAGFGRCGSTMMMRMLDVGGCPIAPPAGPWSYEVEGTEGVIWLWANAPAGTAVKTLEAPSYYAAAGGDLPTRPVRVIWMDRTGREQAKSQRKLLQWTGARIPARACKAFEVSYLRDRDRLIEAYESRGPVATLQYEDVLADPTAAATAVGHWLTEWDLDVDAMAQVVHQRTGRVRPDMVFEETGAAS